MPVGFSSAKPVGFPMASRPEYESRAKALGIPNPGYYNLEELREAVLCREAIQFAICVNQPGCLPETDPYIVHGLAEARTALGSELQITADQLSLHERFVDEAMERVNSAPHPTRENPSIQIELDGYVHEAVRVAEGAADV